MKALLIALQHLPTVLQAVKGVEAVIGNGKGATKKQLVLSSIAAASQAGEASDNVTVAVVSSLVDQVVSVLNSSGEFQKK